MSTPSTSQPARRPALELDWLSFERLPPWWPLAAVTALAAVLRVVGLSTSSLWLDEIHVGTTAAASLPDFFVSIRRGGGADPIDYLGVKAVTTVLGHGTVATRAWALMLGIAAVPLAYALARRVLDSRPAAIVTALLLSLSAFHLHYSQEAGSYALAVVVALLNLLAFARALEVHAIRRWLAYTVSCTAALYGYSLLAFLLPLEGAYVLAVALSMVRSRARGRDWTGALRLVAGCAAAQALAALAYLPWIVFAGSQQLRGDASSLPDLTPDRLFRVFTDLIALAGQGADATADGTAMAVCILSLAIVGLIAGVARRRFLVLPIAAACAAAVPLAWRADQLSRSFFADRQGIVLLPLLFLLAAAGYVELVRLLARVAARIESRGWLRSAGLEVDGRQARAAAVGMGAGLTLVWTVVSVPSIGRVYGNAWETKEDWRGATIFVSANLCPETTLRTQLDADYSYGIVYYNPLLRSRTRYIAGAPAEIEGAVVGAGLGPNDWIVLRPPGQGGGDQESLGRWLTARGWQRASFQGVTVYHGRLCPQSAGG